MRDISKRITGLALWLALLTALWTALAAYDALGAAPTPLAAGSALYYLLTSFEIVPHCLASLGRVAAGFLLAVLAGVTAGWLTVLLRRHMQGFSDTLELLRPIPPIAWIPLSLGMFDAGDGSSYFIIFLGGFFPVFSSTVAGLRSVETILIEAALSLGATKWRTYLRVVWPIALSQVISGTRIGLGVAWMCVVAAEMISAQSGLGYHIQINRQMLALDRVLADMIVIGVLGYAMSAGVSKIERALLPWRNGRIPDSSTAVSPERRHGNFAHRSRHTHIHRACLNGAEIVLENLTFGYGAGQAVFRNFSLKVNAGEFLSIVGPSGCGKSTLLSLIQGRRTAQLGSVIIDDRPLRGLAAEACILFQSFALFPCMNVSENVEFGLRSRGNSKRLARSAARDFLSVAGLQGKACAYPQQLSGGEQQRVALMRALAYGAKILLLDEPLGALDGCSRESLQEDLSLLLHQAGTTVVMVTHDVQEAVFMADRVAVLGDGGEVIQEHRIGPPRPRDCDFRDSSMFQSAVREIRRSLRPEKFQQYSYGGL